MREILFRGKDNATGEWRYSMTISRHYYDDNEIFSYYIGGGYRTIDGKTLGQFTGLTDRNGTKIFEGDIVAYRGDEYGVIVYDEESARFCVSFDTWSTDFDHLYGKELEVIGNKHDNPELIEGVVN